MACLAEQRLDNETFPASSSGVDARSDSPTVLIADDDDAIRMLIRACLEAHGYHVVEATNGARALELFSQHEPSLVMLDVVMPVVDGFTACERLRGLPGAQFVPIVMMTGLDDVGSIQRAYDSGATDFVTKPVNFALLPHRVSYLHRAGQTLCELRQSERRLTSAQHLARLGSWELDLDTRRLHVSPEAASILGLETQSPPGTLTDLLTSVPADDRERLWAAFQSGQIGEAAFGIEHRVVLSDYTERIVYQQVEIDRAGAQDHLVMVGMAQDITERSLAEKKIFDLAHFDPVTGLANRSLFRKRTQAAIQHARDAAQPFAVLSVGLDKFRRINDTCGHESGDKLLAVIARRLEDSIPASEPRATVARLGGDEFTICRPVVEAEEAASIAREVIDLCAQPVDIGAEEVVIGASVGIALFPEHGGDVTQLLERADAAMHQAKSQGGGSLSFHHPSFDETARHRLSMENGLRRALEKGEIEVWYQPKIDLSTNTVSGMEALARWRDPERGIIPPDEFIGLAEETGLIVPLGQHVLERACEDVLRSWRDSGHDLTVAVNLSPKQFADERLSQSILATLEKNGLGSGHLEVEITESALMSDTGSCAEALAMLRRHGVGVAVDDFGTGFASLSYLKQFPIDTVKIDRSFIMDVTTNAESAAITEAILGMSHAMKKSVVAEGVENEEQQEFLRRHGCHVIQGYYYSRPLPAPDMTDWLEQRAPRRSIA